MHLTKKERLSFIYQLRLLEALYPDDNAGYAQMRGALEEGFASEYCGTLFALPEYANMILISALTAVFFLGGWLSPFQGLLGEDSLLGAPGLFWFALKTCFFLFCFLWFRATFPRYRYDQIMRLGWKVFIPVTIVWIFVLGAMIAFQVPPWFA